MDFEKIRKSNRDEKNYLNRIIKKYSRNKNTISAIYREEEK